MINELVTNAFKHAFKDNPEPVLGIILRKESLDTAYLEIRDNGKGLMSAINPNQPNTFGMKVIRLMVENQLDGKFQFFNEGGTVFKSTLKYKMT